MAQVQCRVHSENADEVSLAIQQCTRALEVGVSVKENLVKVYESRARAWSNATQYGRAIEDATAAIKLFPKDATRYVTRGGYKFQNADLDGALADFNQAVKLNPRNSEAYSARSFIFDSKGDARSSLADLDRAIEIDPVNSNALNSRCYVLFKSHGDLNKALADCDAAIKLAPKNAYILHSRCAVKSAMNDYSGALADCTAALKENDGLIYAWVDRGAAQQGLGRFDLAAADFEYALKLKPNGHPDEEAQARAKAQLATIAGHRVASSATPALTAVPPAANPPPTAAVKPPVVAAVEPSAQIPKATVPDLKRVALVIGNSEYRNVPALPNPARDAGVIAGQLKKSGFQSVTLLRDLGRDAMVAALLRFSTEAENADWAVVYYAGHGIEVGGLNYLIPVDAKLASDRSVQFEAIPLDQAMGAVEGARKLRLVILDACRDNPFGQQMKRTVSSRSIGRGMGAVEPEAGTLVVYSAKHGQIALDGDAGNSPFVTALATRMMTPNLDIRRMFDFVRDDVMEATQRRQQPFSYGSLPGSEDFFFVAAK